MLVTSANATLKTRTLRVDREFLQSRDRRRSEQHQCTHNPEGDTCAGRPAERPQHETLGQQLRDQLAPARAEGSPHGDLAGTRLAACEQQIRDVGTRDEKHQCRPSQTPPPGSGECREQSARAATQPTPSRLFQFPGIRSPGCRPPFAARWSPGRPTPSASSAPAPAPTVRRARRARGRGA